MLSTGSSSAGGEDGTWNVAPFENDILRRAHDDDSGVCGGDRGRERLKLTELTRVRR